MTLLFIHGNPLIKAGRVEAPLTFCCVQRWRKGRTHTRTSGQIWQGDGLPDRLWMVKDGALKARSSTNEGGGEREETSQE